LDVRSNLRDWVSRTPVRLYAAILLLTLVGLTLLSLRTDKLLREEVEKKELKESLEKASMAGYFLSEHFQQTIALLQSVVQSESFQRAWKTRDSKALAKQMEQALSLQSDFALISVYDVDGTMRAVDPQNSDLIGANYAYRDWYQGVTRTWSPYVSEVYRTTAASRQLVIAVAVPIF